MTPTRLRRTASAVAVLAAGALVFSACSSGDDDKSGGGSTPKATTVLPGTGWNAADRDKVKDGGTLTLPVDAVPANWQILNLDSGTVDDNTLSTVYLPSFVTFAEDGSWKANPDYATSVALKSDDPQVVEVKLNPKAVWSDGTPMSYKDVAANWKALNGTNKDFNPVSTNVWQDVSSVTKGTDDQDVLLTFKKKNADWPSILTAIYPEWAVKDPKTFNNAWAKGPFAADGKTFVSGGPFIVTKFDANGGVVTFGKNPKWWGDPAKLDQIVFKVVSRAGLPQAFANSELDAINLYGSADAYKTAQGRSDAQIERSLGTTFRHITLNGTSQVFSDVNVRKAFAAGLNRSILAQAILSGVESPVELLNNLIYLPGQKGYEDHLGSVLTGDAKAAQKVLTDNGYTIGSDGYAAKDGKTLSVRFVIPSDNPNSANIAQLVQQQEKAVGFKVNIDVVPTADFFTKYITTTTRNFDATYFAWQGTPFPVSSTESIYYAADSGQNYPGVTDDSLGAAWSAANAELDPAKRIDLANGIDKTITQLFTTIPLFPEPNAWAAKKTLANYGPTQFQSVPWQNVGFTG
jgi:peptide/nickel transport system substrate-binding protein